MKNHTLSFVFFNSISADFATNWVFFLFDRKTKKIHQLDGQSSLLFDLLSWSWTHGGGGDMENLVKKKSVSLGKKRLNQ